MRTPHCVDAFLWFLQKHGKVNKAASPTEIGGAYQAASLASCLPENWNRLVNQGKAPQPISEHPKRWDLTVVAKWVEWWRDLPLTIDPEEECVYSTPEGNRLNRAAFVKRLGISAVLFYLRQRKGLWPGFLDGRIPSQETLLPFSRFSKSRQTEATFLESDANLANERLRAAREFRVADGYSIKTPPPFVSGNETGWHDCGTYYGTNRKGLTGFWVTPTEAIMRFPQQLTFSRVGRRYRLNRPSRFLLDDNGKPSKLRSMLAPVCPVFNTKKKRHVIFLKDVQALAEAIASNALIKEVSKAVFVDENGIRWPTAAQAKAIHGATEALCRKWATKTSILDPTRKALRVRQVPNPQRGSHNEVEAYCEPDLLNILQGKESRRPGAGTGCNANRLRALLREAARKAIFSIISKGQRVAPSTVYKRAREEFNLSPSYIQEAFKLLRGRAEGTGLNCCWRLPDYVYTSQQPGQIATGTPAAARPESATTARNGATGQHTNLTAPPAGEKARPLVGKAARAFDYIRDNPGALGKNIAKAIRVSSAYFRKKLVPLLKQHGVLNEGSGYRLGSPR
jgi:hypothetical protein